VVDLHARRRAGVPRRRAHPGRHHLRQQPDHRRRGAPAVRRRQGDRQRPPRRRLGGVRVLLRDQDRVPRLLGAAAARAARQSNRMNRVGLAILVVLAAACPPAIPFPAGCGKDTDCKGSRICVANACIDPPKAKSANANANANVNANANGNANANADGGAPGPSVDLGAADLASPPPLGASPMFHGDALHTGRSRFRAPQTQPREVMHVATGGVVYSSPAIGDDVLVFGSHDRSIYATSLDGTIRWRRPTGDLVWSAPALGSGGVAYVGSDDDHLYALDLKDGSL